MEAYITRSPSECSTKSTMSSQEVGFRKHKLQGKIPTNHVPFLCRHQTLLLKLGHLISLLSLDSKVSQEGIKNVFFEPTLLEADALARRAFSMTVVKIAIPSATVH